MSRPERTAMKPPYVWALALTILLAAGSLLPQIRFFDSPAPYLPLHTTLEFFALAISAMVFALGWSLREREDSGRVVLLGTVFLAVCLIDFAHTLSYKGMPEFVTPSDPEKAINFWLAARLVAALGLLSAALLPRRRWTPTASSGAAIVAVGVAGMVIWIGLFHADRLPRTFIEGQGLTPFKIGFEYTLALLYAAAALLLYRKARLERDADRLWLAAAAWVLGLAELFFTLYADVTDLFNLLGHIYKVAAYLMIYLALFASGVRAPYSQLAGEKARLRALIDSLPDMVFFKDTRSAFLGYNKVFEAYCGQPERELLGKTDCAFAPPNMAESCHQEDNKVLSEGRPHHSEAWVTYPDGRKALLDTIKTPFYGPDGELLGLIGVSRDITGREAAEQALRESEQYNKLLFADSRIPLVVMDPASGTFVDCNEAAVRIYRLPNREAVLGLTPLDVSAPVQYDGTDSAVAARQQIDEAQATGSHVFEWRHRRPDGETWDAEVHLMTFQYQGETLLQFSLQDITERRRMEAELRRLATTDSLTGASNRRHFLENLEQEIGRVGRFGTPAAVLMLDLDHFKRVNDQYGHAAGDAVLQHFAATCGRHLRRTDLFGRLGGEEFAVLLPGTDLKGARDWAERLRETVAATPVPTESGPVAFTVSIGAAAIRSDDPGPDAILARADSALYRAKDGGRNRVELEGTT